MSAAARTSSTWLMRWLTAYSPQTTVLCILYCQRQRKIEFEKGSDVPIAFNDQAHDGRAYPVLIMELVAPAQGRNVAVPWIDSSVTNRNCFRKEARTLGLAP